MQKCLPQVVAHEVAIGLDHPKVLRYPTGTRVHPNNGLMSRITYPDSNFDYFRTLDYFRTNGLAALPDMAYVTLLTFREPADELTEKAFRENFGNVSLDPSVKLGNMWYRNVGSLKRQLDRTENELAETQGLWDFLQQRRLRRDYAHELARVERDSHYSFYAALLNAPLIIRTEFVEEAADLMESHLAQCKEAEFTRLEVKWGNVNDKLREIYEKHSGASDPVETSA